MSYPKVLNKQGELLAILNDIRDISIKKQINGEYSLSISTITNELKSDVTGKYFCINFGK